MAADRCHTCNFLHPPIAVCRCGYCVHSELANRRDANGDVMHWDWHDGWVRVWKEKKR